MRLLNLCKVVIAALVLALPLWLGAASIAQAQGPGWWHWFGGGHHEKTSRFQHFQEFHSTTHSVPELDPDTAGAAALLVAGGALILFDRRRRRRS